MELSGRRWPHPDLRVGDADRQGVVAELQRHYVDGRRTREELGERVAHTLNARTFADLAEPLADLPPLPRDIEPAAPATTPDWHSWLTPQLGAILVVVGIMLLMMLVVMPGGRMGL